MSMRRNTGRDRRAQPQVVVGGVVVPNPVWKFDFQAANVSKGGTDLISQVNEQISGVDNATQATEARKPLWTSNGAPSGTRDIALFAPDGANLKTLSRTPAAAPFDATGYTVFCVFNRVLAATGAWNTWLYNTGAARGGWALQTTSGANGRKFEARTSAGTVKSATYGTYTLDTWECHTIRNYGGGANDVASDTWFDTRVNGAQVAWTGTPWFWIPTSHAMTFGQAATTALNDLKIGAARMYLGLLSDAQCAAVEAELMSAYGL